MMYRISLLFLIAVFLFGCSDSERQKSGERLSSNQTAIISDYSKVDAYMLKPMDSLTALAARMEIKAMPESAKYKAMAQIVTGVAYSGNARFQLSFKSFETALKLLEKKGNDTLRARALCGIGNYYKNTSDYPKALQFFLSGLTIYERTKNTRGLIATNGNIGSVYMEKNDMKLAREHLEKALRIGKDSRHKFAYLNSAHTLANVYGISGEFQKAMELDKMAIKICDSIGLDKLKTAFLDNKANCYFYSGRIDSAEYYFNECLKIDLKTGDKKQIADTYSNLGNIELARRQYAKAETYVKRSISMIGDMESKHNILKCYQILIDIYKASGKKDLALKTQDEYMDAYAREMNEKKEEALAEFKVVHETEKKEQIIARNRIELLEKEDEVRTRNSWIVIISLLSVFSALVLFLIYRQQKLRNYQQEQEHELKTAIGRIETQNKLQEQRLSISRDLHDNIGSQLTFVISSVDNLRYAFDLKGSKLDDKLQNISQFTQSTIVELRDTIWAMNHAEISFEDLRSRVYNFIEKAQLARQDIAFSFDIDSGLGDLKFSSVKGMNIYRTIQEAINNSIKHSNASKVSVFIKKEISGIAILIEDDGNGFETSGVEGNGLRNMKKRIEDIGGTFAVVSFVNKGTQIQVNLTDPKA
ncbi:tetratricopeptide repeat-containing sensor histidine kinase [Flavobacterium silvaticum]|uniref:Tetratricopeptide repeat protein n=1 Tax=Flavobacterium silvaticum TaxID=1852020 RepID=A0A972JEC5_9FLAO|nr:tetratricopeptide repeat protein [Flavobacterium silvaticum]NMH26729.1 tetratricopeptide repeat protein [Flavobacterium silvaticum]